MSASPNTQPMVLIVDDEPHIVLTIRYLIERIASPRFLTAADGRTASRLAAKHRPDLVILDLILPEIDGYTACREIREAWGKDHDGAIWLISGRNSLLDADQTSQVGANRLITKPFDPDALSQDVKQLLASRPKH